MLDIAAWRRRWPRLDAVLTVNDRFGAVKGGPLSSSITLAAFLSLFPMVLVALALVGFLSSGDSQFTGGVVSDLGLQGSTARTIETAIAAAEERRGAASVVGFVGLLAGGLGVVGALQTALNAVWQVGGRGLIDRLVALRWLAGAGVLFLATAGLGPLLRLAPGPARPLGVLVGLGITSLLFVWTFTSLGNSHVGWRAHLPGALLVAVGVEILKVLGTFYVPRLVARSSALYGSLGVVFAVLAWLAIYGRLIVYGAVLNVVRYEHRAGTVSVEIDVPRVGGTVPLSANRGGAVDEQVVATDDR